MKRWLEYLILAWIALAVVIVFLQMGRVGRW